MKVIYLYAGILSWDLVQILSGICIRNFQWCYSNRGSIARIDGYFFVVRRCLSDKNRWSEEIRENNTLENITSTWVGSDENRLAGWENYKISDCWTELDCMFSLLRDPHILTMESYQLHECLTYLWWRLCETIEKINAFCLLCDLKITRDLEIRVITRLSHCIEMQGSSLQNLPGRLRRSHGNTVAIVGDTEYRGDR